MRYMVHDVNIHFTGLWRTRQTEDMDSDREMHVKTTLRELVIYIFFIVILCICK
jgi:polycystin 2